jgi:hypothetical protein
VTTGKSAAQRPNLMESLGHISEVLPREKLRALQKAAEQGALTDEILVKEIGDRGLLLVAFGAAASSSTAIRQTTPPDIVSRVEELMAHVNSFAPVLFNHPRIKAMAQRFAETAQPSDDPPDRALPFDDINGIRGATTHLDLDGEFTPTVRLEISFTNRPALPVLSLRLVDIAFLASSLLSSLAAALESSARLAPHGLLDKSELEGPRAHLESLTDELARVSSYLQDPIVGSEPAPSPKVGNPASE